MTDQRRIQRRIRVVALEAVLAVSVIGGVAWASTSLSTTSPPAPAPHHLTSTGSGDSSGVPDGPPALPTRATTIDSAELAAFGILRRTLSATDAVPSQAIAGMPATLFGAREGANTSLARRVTGLTLGAAWVVPGSDGVCLIAESGATSTGAPTADAVAGATCTSDAAAIAGTLSLVGGGANLPGQEFVSGIVPDGVGSVSVELTDGTLVQATVHDNVYTQIVEGTVATVHFVGADGSTTVQEDGP